MSNTAEGIQDDDLLPSETKGFKVGEKRSLAELASLDQEDESLQKWKASLGLSSTGAAGSEEDNIKIISLALIAESRPGGPIVLDLEGDVNALKNLPVVIKEGAEYAVELTFKVNNEVISGLRYIHVVRRAGLNLDKFDQMIGSYGPSPNPVVKRFETSECPSGILARSGSYSVRSRVTDDDQRVHVDFSWGFKIAKDW